MARPKVTLPEKGIPEEDLIKEMEELRNDDTNWREGKVWSLVYHATDKHTEMLKKAYTMFFSKNALSPIAFPSLKKFEIEVISMAVDIRQFHTPPDADGQIAQTDAQPRLKHVVVIQILSSPNVLAKVVGCQINSHFIFSRDFPSNKCQDTQYCHQQLCPSHSTGLLVINSHSCSSTTDNRRSTQD